jgi:hypothetical protein
LAVHQPRVPRRARRAPHHAFDIAADGGRSWPTGMRSTPADDRPFVEVGVT